jgi:hypothetical protein
MRYIKSIYANNIDVIETFTIIIDQNNEFELNIIRNYQIVLSC